MRSRRSLLGLALSSVLLGAGLPASAQKGQPLILGSEEVLRIRVGDTLNGKKLTVDDRIGRVEEVFAKHLGGKGGVVSRKKVGSRVHLYLNGDFVLAVTSSDAAGTGYKTVDRLANVWQSALRKAFAASSAVK